jgi:hypothetical protein
MIRGITKLGVLLLVVAAVSCSRSSELEITEVERVVNLAGGYPTETVKINFRANEDSISHFTFLLPLEYDGKVSKLGFTKNSKDKSTLAFTRSIIIHVPLSSPRTAHLSPATPSVCPATTRLATRAS